jgi:hypothetical protein
MFGGIPEPIKWAFAFAYGQKKPSFSDEPPLDKLYTDERPHPYVRFGSTHPFMKIVRNKMSPGFGLLYDSISGTTPEFDEKEGKYKEFDWRNVPVNMTAPISWKELVNDLQNGTRTDRAMAEFMAQFFGETLQNRKAKPPRQGKKEAKQEVTEAEFMSMSEAEQNALREKGYRLKY